MKWYKRFAIAFIALGVLHGVWMGRSGPDIVMGVLVWWILYYAIPVGIWSLIRRLSGKREVDKRE